MRTPSARTFIARALLMVILLAPAGTAVAAEALEFETNVAQSRLELNGHERIRGLTPLEVPGPLTGEFWLNATSPQMESQRGRVRIGLDETGSRIVSHSRVPVRERVLSGLMFPGCAQLRYQERGKGIALGAAGAASLALGIWSQFDLWDAEDQVDAAALALTETGIGDEERFARENALGDAEGEKDFASKRRNLLLGAAAATWGIGLLDALAFAPDFRVRSASASSLSLSLRRRSRLQAGVRSLMFPGLGQHYYGENGRALLAAAGGLAAVGYLLYEQDDYNDAVKAQDQAESRLDLARSEEERVQLRIARNAARDEADSQSRDRDLALGITIGVWGLSLLDTLWSPPESVTGAPVLGLAADPASRSLAARIRF